MSSRSDRLRAPLAIATVSLALAGLGGCGGDAGSEPPVTDEAGKRIPVADVGNRREVRDIAGRLERIQDNFRAGRYGAVCRQVSDFLLEQFPPDPSARRGSCEDKMKAFAATLDDDGPSLEVISVRVYPGIEAGVWVSNGEGVGYRVPFVWDISESRWKLELGAFTHPEALAGELDRST